MERRTQQLRRTLCGLLRGKRECLACDRTKSQQRAHEPALEALQHYWTDPIESELFIYGGRHKHLKGRGNGPS